MQIYVDPPHTSPPSFPQEANLFKEICFLGPEIILQNPKHRCSTGCHASVRLQYSSLLHYQGHLSAHPQQLLKGAKLQQFILLVTYCQGNNWFLFARDIITAMPPKQEIVYKFGGRGMFSVMYLSGFSQDLKEGGFPERKAVNQETMI